MSFRSPPLHPPAFSVDCRSSVAWRDTPSALLCQSSRYVRFGAVSDTPPARLPTTLFPFEPATGNLSRRPPRLYRRARPFPFLSPSFFAASSKRLVNVPRREMGATEGEGAGTITGRKAPTRFGNVTKHSSPTRKCSDLRCLFFASQQGEEPWK